MMKTQVIITVEKIRGNYPIYKTGDKILINNFYMKSKDLITSVSTHSQQ
jgi:hypothetical protein